MLQKGVQLFSLVLLCLVWEGVDLESYAQPVVINELVAVSSDHLLNRTLSVHSHQLGRGLSWKENDFDDGVWTRGVGPFGFRQSIPLGTNLESVMKRQTPSLYTRGKFDLTAAEIDRLGSLLLNIHYDDAFIAYLNGRELARRNLGHPGFFVFADQPSFNKSTLATNEVIEIARPWEWLRPGTNVLAIQGHAAWPPQDGDPNRVTFLMGADLHAGLLSSPPLVAATNEWSYFVGLTEPSGSLLDFPTLATDLDAAAFADWIELKNQSDTGIDLGGWSLTDDRDQPRQWIMPSVVLPAGQCVVLFCSGLDRTTPGSFWHTNFKLDEDGEYVGLFDSLGSPVHELQGKYPRQSPFHSYGRDPNPNSSRYGYFEVPTPGRSNSGEFLAAMCETPRFSIEAGFHDGPLAVTIESLTLGGAIRYTLDGTEPALDYGEDYVGPILLATNTTLRARVYRPGWVPSRVQTATYLIDQHESLRSIPALMLAGSSERAFYKPEGVTAISGGRFGEGIVWAAESESDYHMATMYGKAFERPVSLEWIGLDGADYVQADCGIRYAGSSFSRPRMTMFNLPTTIWNNNWPNKPSFSFFFRNEYGPGTLDLNLLPGFPVHTYDSLRLRAGKNDWANPFIRDEVVRRLFTEMGQLTSRGQLCGLFINGHYKGYFNIVERLRESFFQDWTGSTSAWDVRFVDAVEEGDADRWNMDMTFMRTAPMDDPANYDDAASRFDLENVVDYIILNGYCAMSDWPFNNWYMARERSSEGKWRFQVWDAEGAFGAGTSKKADYNTILYDLNAVPPYPTSPAQTIPVIYTALKQNPEFRLLFADRLQHHLFGNGALTPENVVSNYTHWWEVLDPSINYVRNQSVAIAYLLDWVEDRPPNLLQFCRNAGLWPNTRAPEVEPMDSILPVDATVSLSNPNPNGQIYYTLDGSDPRSAGGEIQGELYLGPLMTGGPVHLKARVRQGGEWSPLAEVHYTAMIPKSLEITEINYAPVGNDDYDGPEFEFVELQNRGADPIDLTGVRFTDGIDLVFTNGPILQPGAFAVIVAHETAFLSRYPETLISGVFDGRLNNAGERITLSFSDATSLFSVDYNDLYPWPALARRSGFTLVPSGIAGVTPDDAAYWRVSSFPGGSPGQMDPDPLDYTVHVHELTAGSSTGSPAFIELSNDSGVAVDVSGWYLSLDPNDPLQYRLPSDTIISGGGFIAIDPHSLTSLSGVVPFSLSSTGGVIGVFSSGLAGELTGYAHFVVYDAALRDSVLGYHVDSLDQPHFVSLDFPTPGGVNAPPRVSPVVINEIQYDPAGDAQAYIEIWNASALPQALYHETDSFLTWRLNGVEFNFPATTVLDPGEVILISEGDPEALRIERDVPPAVRIFGPWRGELEKGGEWLRLEKPAFVPSVGGNTLLFVSVDQVRFNDRDPWPIDGLGQGSSLQRRQPIGFGNDPAEWFAARSTAGRSNAITGIVEPKVHLIRPQDGLLVSPGAPLVLEVDVSDAPGPIAFVEYRFNDEVITRSEQAPFSATVIPPQGIHSVRALVRFLPGLDRYTEEAELRVLGQVVTNTTTVPMNAVWKYDDRGLDLGTAWVFEEFDDSTWSEGPAQLGYGEEDEATVVDFGLPSPSRNVTAYFRRRFFVPNGLKWNAALLRIVRDDGAVVYVNGVEVARSNMPEGAINYLTHAASASLEENDPVKIPIDSTQIRTGWNQLAVEIHQVHRSSPDMSFSLELVLSDALSEPWIAQQPDDVVVSAGGTAYFEIEAVGEDLSYQWYESSGHPVMGGVGPRLDLAEVFPGDAPGYYVVVRNFAGDARSETALLRITQPDTDQDSMPDYWEQRFALDPADASDADEDLDGDGQSNAQEFVLGTHPGEFNAILYLQIVGEGTARPMVRLQFEVPAGFRAYLQFSRDLSEPSWEDAQSFGPWSTSTFQTWDADMDGEGGFFRLYLDEDQ